jgi:transcription elongation factor S-II
MSCKEEVIKIGKKLEKMVSSNTQDNAAALDMMKTLKRLRMNLDVLQKTHIGMTVNNFRKSSKDDEVISLAKSLIKSWKKLLPGDNASSSTSRSDSTASTPKDEDSPKENEKDQEDSGSGSGGEGKEKPDLNRSASFPPRAPDTADGIRLKCRELLTNALKIDDPPEGALDPEDLAAAIEDSVYNIYQNTDSKYKTKVRSRVSNLRDSKNPNLRLKVLTGDILPEKLANMTPEEMCSDDMKKLRDKYTKQAINDHQLSQQSGTTTDLLKCGRCKKRSVTYNQVQTRSADEPMTTFCLCNDCGNRWKFC